MPVPVTKPDAHNLLLEIESVRDNLQLFTCWFWILIKCPLESDPDIGFNRGPFLSPPPDSIE